MNRALAKGNRFETDIVAYLRDHIGPHVCRNRAGEAHDRGDIGGIPRWTLELKCHTDMLRAIREGLADLAVEQATTATPHGLVIVKRRGVGDPARQLAVLELGGAVDIIKETMR